MHGLPEAFLIELQALREELHRFPERSNEEHLTQQILERALRGLGLVPRRVAGTGLLAEVVGDAEGPLVCIRGDIDGLPVHEESGLPYSSERPGFMHACGHDVHAAAAWGATARLLADPPPGRVRLLLQPAEERGTGARACVEAGAMQGVQAVLGGHVDLDYPVGTVALQPGPMCASTDHFRVTVTGRGGHGARPHQGTDALLAAAQVVVALQGVVAREIEPGLPAVVTVGTLQAGERYNILAGRAVMEGTLRSQDPAVREHLRAAVQRVARGVAEAHGAQARYELFPGNEPVVNDGPLTEVVDQALQGLLGQGAVVPLARLNLGGEDFSELHQGCPGVYVRWGASGPGAAEAPAHAAGFRVDEGVLAVAAAGLEAAARAAIAWLREAR